MKTVQIQIDIAASQARVWQVLTQELPRAPAPYGILEFEGKIRPQALIRLRSEVAPSRSFALRVCTLQAPDCMVWRGGMPLGLFTGTRTFTLSQTGQVTRFKMQEVFSGWLSGLITRSMPDLLPSFEQFAQTLKKEAEAR